MNGLPMTVEPQRTSKEEESNRHEHNRWVLERVFPDNPPKKYNLIDGLSSSDVASDAHQLAQGVQLQRELQPLVDQLTRFQQTSRCPIVGITGILNAGKSSLLATYLSPENRGRVLRGVSNQAGTHRFVLWFPERWKAEPDLYQTLIEFITQIFGHSPEPLAKTAAEAELQYNGRLLYADNSTSTIDPIGVPLVAFDRALNDLQLGLMDCPDIQTGQASDGSHQSQIDDTSPLASIQSAAARQRWLAKLSQLCSAFVVVAKLNSLHDQSLDSIFATLQTYMPRVTRVLAVNRIKARYSPEQIAEQSAVLVHKYAIARVYAAYDFRSALASNVVPPVPTGMLAELDGSAQPLFFRVSSVEAQPEYLFHLAQWLEPGMLAEEHARGLKEKLRASTRTAIQWAESNLKFRQERVHDAWLAIAKSCYDFMAERDSSGNCTGLRLQTSPALIAQLTDSLYRTAPVWMRLSLSIDRTARQLQQVVAKKAEGLKLINNVSQAVTDRIRKWRRGEGAAVVTGESVANSIRKFDAHAAFQSLPFEKLVELSDGALKRFAAEDHPELDQTALDCWSKSIWDNMSTWSKIRKGVQPLALVTGPLLAAMLIPFDGGGSAVLVFASTKELLAAAGISMLMAPVAGGGETLRIVQEETPWKQLSDLFAILCDTLGVPRPDQSQLPSCGTPAKNLLHSRMEPQPAGLDSPFSLWRLRNAVDTDELRQ